MIYHFLSFNFKIEYLKVYILFTLHSEKIKITLLTFCNPDAIGVTDNNLFDPFTTQIIFVITAKVDHAFRGDFQNTGRQGAYELTVV